MDLDAATLELLPNARKVRLQLYGSEVRPHGHLSLLDGWFEVWAQPGMYEDHMESPLWRPPALWFAEVPDLYSATWPIGDDDEDASDIGCQVRQGAAISHGRVIVAAMEGEALGERIPEACMWRMTFEELGQHAFPMFVTTMHRGEDTLTRRLLVEDEWIVGPPHQSWALNPFAQNTSHTVDLLDVSRGRNYKTRLWSHYVKSEPEEFERRPVHAWNRYLLQFNRPLCKRGDRSCLWRIAERLGTEGLRQLREISPVEHLEEALELLIELTGPVFDDNVDDIQEAPTSMMDHW